MREPADQELPRVERIKARRMRKSENHEDTKVTQRGTKERMKA